MNSDREVRDTIPSIHRLRWTLRFDQPYRAPFYLGSALRGLLGHGLRRTACVTRQKNCRGCALVDTCVYTGLFEPTARSKAQGPVPYVLSVPVTKKAGFAPGEVFHFEMSLLSTQAHQLPYLVQAYRNGGRNGLGPDKVGFEVAEPALLRSLGTDQWRPISGVRDGLGPGGAAAMDIPPPPSRIMLEWLTPWRFKRLGHFVGPDEFRIGMLFESLLYRRFELEGRRPPKALLAQAREAVLDAEAELHWEDWSRYSSRQKTRMRVGGLMGRITIDSEGLAPWWPLLWFGQWLHLGKFTSMGLGRYRLGDASLPAPFFRPISCILDGDGKIHGGIREGEGSTPSSHDTTSSTGTTST